MEPEISAIIPVFGEGAHLSSVLGAIESALSEISPSYEVIVVDDGSKDDTWSVIRSHAGASKFLRALRLSRNYGKEHAICAGLEASRGRAAIIMDGDFQHPPALISELVRKWREEGCAIVEAVKRSRPPERGVNRAGARVFYWLLVRFTRLDLEGATDFKLLDRRVIEAWKTMGERLTFFRGMTAWLGFKRCKIPFDPPERVSGKSGWGFWALVRLAINGLTSFTSLPLRMVTMVGLIFLGFAVILGAQTFYMKASGQAVSGFTTVILLTLILGSVVMFALGIIGEYIANIYEEVKKRPRYVVAEILENQ